jgi:hypothetical protein
MDSLKSWINLTSSLCRKEKRAIEEFERKSGGEGRARGVGTLKSWINLKIETDKNHQVYKAMFSNINLHFHGLQFYFSDVYFFVNTENPTLGMNA